ncbi:MAG: hypothetical protein WAV41_05870 [Microgenomates group bacterium]
MSTESKNHQILILLSILFVTILGIIYLYVNRSPIVTFTPPSPEINKNKLFTNGKFEFTYPTTLELLQGQDQITFKTPLNNQIQIQEVTDNSKTIADYLAKRDKESQASWEGMPSVDVVSMKKTVINGLNCIRREEHLLAADITQTSTYFKQGDLLVIITLLPIPGNTRGDDQAIYDQILSTFKFIDITNTQTVKIYFHNPAIDPNFDDPNANDYKLVTIPKTNTPLKDSLDELIKLFITEDEKAYGSRVLNFRLKSAIISSGVAKLVFEDPEFYTSGGSTRVGLLYSQIEKTALQFPSVKKVEISGATFQP